MTEQHPIGDHISDESLRARSWWRVRSDHTNLTGSPSGGVTLTRTLGTLLVVLVWWVGQHPWSVEDPTLAAMSRVPTEGQLQHRELNMHATYDAVADQRATMVSLSVPLPPPPVPPAPVPVVPAPVIPRPVPVVPAPVIPRPVPVVPAPVIPRPVPVVPAPTPVFPPPVLALYQVPNLVGDDLITAERVLVQDGLTVGLITEQASDQPAGTILQTNPEANTAVPSGTAINLVVAE
jgi:hypothetical protein